MNQLTKLTKKMSFFTRPVILAGFYITWGIAFRLITLTLMTYFLMFSGPKLRDISEVYSSNEILMVSIASVAFITLMALLYPIVSVTRIDLFTFERLKTKFLPGLTRGALLATILTAVFLLSGHYKYLGYFIQFDETLMVLSGVFIRCIAIIVMVYSEEYLFRHKMLDYLRDKIPDIYAAVFISLAFSIVKLLQFDLTTMHFITILMFSFILTLKAIREKDFIHGAGIWAGILIVFHPLLGLPILGNDFSGILLIKYEDTTAAFGGTDSQGMQFLTGGDSGPLAGFAIQSVLILLVILKLYQNRKILLELISKA